MAPVQSARSVIHWEAAPSRPAGPTSQPASEITPLCWSGLHSPRSSERHPVHLAHLSHPGHSVTQATLFTWLTWFPGCHIALLSHLVHLARFGHRVHRGHQVLTGTRRAAERPSRLGHQSPVSASLICCLGRAAEWSGVRLRVSSTIRCRKLVALSIHWEAFWQVLGSQLLVIPVSSADMTKTDHFGA